MIDGVGRNDVLRFLLDLGTLFGLGAGGWSMGRGRWRWVLALLPPGHGCRPVGHVPGAWRSRPGAGGGAGLKPPDHRSGCVRWWCGRVGRRIWCVARCDLRRFGSLPLSDESGAGPLAAPAIGLSEAGNMPRTRPAREFRCRSGGAWCVGAEPMIGEVAIVLSRHGESAHSLRATGGCTRGGGCVPGRRRRSTRCPNVTGTWRGGGVLVGDGEERLDPSPGLTRPS